MKNFQNYAPEKYMRPDFQKIEEGIYKTRSQDDETDLFVTSLSFLSFEMEPERYGEEDTSPENPAQIPFEDLLDEFCVFVTDFYDELNEKSDTLCYQEFGSPHLEDVQNLRTLIGKRFYAVSYIDVKDGKEYYNTVIE